MPSSRDANPSGRNTIKDVHRRTSDACQTDPDIFSRIHLGRIKFSREIKSDRAYKHGPTDKSLRKRPFDRASRPLFREKYRDLDIVGEART